MYPDLNEAINLSKTGLYRVIPVTMELYADIGTPIEVMRLIRSSGRPCFILESVEKEKRWGRYTFLGFDPKLELTCLNGLVTLREASAVRHISTTNPALVIRRVLSEYQSPHLPDLPPFTGGLAGYFAYDYIKYTEPKLRTALDLPDPDHFLDFDLKLYDQLICFDHFRQRIILIAHARTDALLSSYSEAVENLTHLSKLILSGKAAPIEPLRLKSPFTKLFGKEDFCDKVIQAKKHIREGDAFQIVLSNCMEADATGSLFDVYRVLRTTNPSPYLFYFASDDIEMAGASPETLVRLEGRQLTTYPLAGTRPRGRSEAEDLALEQELLSDEKELSEHNMLVDLGRNDIGRISEIGSVHVDSYQSVERFSHVMHLASTISGQLRSEYDALDAISAILPAGTLSGAPKLRACEIISRLEGSKRGIYGGAIGYLDLTGNMDVCIAIRFTCKKNDKVFVRSGAGIVADSQPENEYMECRNKAKGVLLAIKQAEGGILE